MTLTAWPSEDHIHISCVVSLLEDDCIEVPPRSVQRSICESVAAQAPVEVVFHVGAECQVIWAIRADVAKVSCVMEAMLYSLGVESNSETITIIDTNRDGFSVPIVCYWRITLGGSGFMGHSCQCPTLFTLGRRHVPSRKVEAALCILTYDWAVVCTNHPKFMHDLCRRLPKGLYHGPL
jgi:hypothetical protein